MRGFLNQNWVCIHKEKREEDVGKATKCPSQYEPLCEKMRRLYNSSSSSFIHSFIHWLDGYLLGAYSVLSPRQTYWGTSGIFQILHIFFIHLPHMEASSHIKRQMYSHGTLKKKKKKPMFLTLRSHIQIFINLDSKGTRSRYHLGPLSMRIYDGCLHDPTICCGWGNTLVSLPWRMYWWQRKLHHATGKNQHENLPQFISVLPVEIMTFLVKSRDD